MRYQLTIVSDYLMLQLVLILILESVGCAPRRPVVIYILPFFDPYLTPVPYRGRANSPAYTYYVAEKLAEIRGVSVDNIAQQTTQNFKDLFFSK